MALLRKVLTELDSLSGEVTSMLSSADKPTSPRSLSEEGRQVAKALKNSATELRDIVSSFKPQSSSDQSDVEMEGDMDDEDVSMEAVRRRLEAENESAMDAIKNAAAAILPLIDPPPHSSIFGLDVLRGSVLSRYRGAKQLWIPRPSGGRLDAMFIPAVSAPADGIRKAVVYCNPNAGLIEVATGMGLAGGNVVPGGGSKSHTCWADFYTQQGYDIYLFNYAGFGRSDGRHFCSIGSPTNAPGFLAAIRRIFHFTFLTFKVTRKRYHFPVYPTLHAHLCHFLFDLSSSAHAGVPQRGCQNYWRTRNLRGWLQILGHSRRKHRGACRRWSCERFVSIVRHERKPFSTDLR